MAVVQSATELRFPPFPAGPPPGVIIIPFAQWQETGILKETPDQIERDTLGIATVPMGAKAQHATDHCKSNSVEFSQVGKDAATRKNKKGAAAAKVEWVEDWKLLERYVQPGGYDPNTWVTDRVRAAALDYAHSRTWPKENETGSSMSIRQQWDKFQVYLGILNNQQDHNQKKIVEEIDDDGDDDDFPDGEPGMASQGHETLTADTAPRTEIDKGEKLWSFCDDPEKSISVFLSSYMFEQGLIYSDRMISSIPRLVRFFLIYLIKNKVFSSEQEKRLSRALKIVEIAIIELPLTSKIPKVLPDFLNSALLHCFEIKPDIHYPDDYDRAAEADSASIVPPETAPDVDVEMSEEAAMPELTSTAPAAVHESSTHAAAPAADPTLAPAWGTPSPWAGDGNAGWATGEASWNTWASASTELPIIPNPWEDTEWDLPEPEFLMHILGATALPLTHTHGIVEQSTRRITQIIPPSTTLPPKTAVSKGPSADAVEAELEQRFTRVVLTPWDDPAVNKPTIHKLSEGAVLVEGEGGPVSGAGMLKPHNPWKDSITILVETETAAVMALGLGIGGSFVQIARVDDFGQVDEKDSKPKKKSKRGQERFWYVSGVTLTLASYHVLAESG